MAKDIIKKLKRETYEMGENICKPYNRKWLMSKICKKFIPHNVKMTNNPILKGQRT